MSRTLFRYVFWDLLKIFFMASGALAGIMSFGGLLRPLTQNGLDGSQVALLLKYSMPAMSTYSLPVAALFATTVVYGRMAADNEITACRACGISFLAMATPAALLGLLVAIGSMFMLCFTVPLATLKIERVVVSNLAKVMEHEVEQSHEIHYEKYVIFAQKAHLQKADPNKPHEQAVILQAPLIVTYAPPPPNDPWFHVAKDFWMAKQAVAYIDENPDDDSATLTATLTDGVIFPRRFIGPKSEQGGLAAAQFGPVSIPSRLGQKPKFMDIFQLKALEKDPARGRDVQKVTARFIREDQANNFAAALTGALNAPAGRCDFILGVDTFTVTRGDAPATWNRDSVFLTTPPGKKPILLRQESGGQTRLTVEARSARISVSADTPNDQLMITMDLSNALVDAGDTPIPKATFEKTLVAPMPPFIAEMKTRTADQYLNSNLRPEPDRQELMFAWWNLVNHLSSEMHARAAFVVSCLLLVMIGASLGMMFRSGNFLTAFAVSVIPAMLSVVLIVTGQHTAESTPMIIKASNNPLEIGIGIIWSGNVLIGIAAVALLWRLQRK